MASNDINITLYNGLYQMEYKDSTHRYKVNGKQKRGVTGIIDEVIAKKSLMMWPLTMAMKHLGGTKDADGWKLAKETKLTEELLNEAYKAHAQRRDKGADTGSQVHALAEDIMAGRPIEWEAYPSEVQKAAKSYEQWFTVSRAEVVAVENLVYSQEQDYAGTFDSILRLDGKTYLCDLKTTNPGKEAPEGVYISNFIQLGGYLRAYNEQREYEQANGGSELVEIDDLMIVSSKKNGETHIKTASSIGLTPGMCIMGWDSVWFLMKFLKDGKKALGGR